VLPSCASELPEGFAAGEWVGGAVRNLGMEVWSPLQRSDGGLSFFALTV